MFSTINENSIGGMDIFCSIHLHANKGRELPPPIEADGFLVNISIETSLPKLKRMFHPRIITSYIASFSRFLLAFISLS